MANREHLSIISKSVSEWNRWRRANPSSRPDFSGDVLVGAEFDNALLTDADFIAAYCLAGSFESASLTGTDFRLATLHDVRLAGADLSGLIMGGTVLANVDLSGVKGLGGVRHFRPSRIDFHTLFRSGGRIPESFLRGCGLPEEFIRYLPSLLNQPIQFYSCFISYSHEDKAFARLLHDRLQGQGIRCWLDEHQLLPGDDLHEVIDRGIRLWDKVLLCASKS